MTHPIALAAVLATTLVGASTCKRRKDYNAMIQQSMARMNAIVGQAEQRVNGAVQQRMQDPAVQAAGSSTWPAPVAGRR